MNETVLQDIARAGGGGYYRAQADGGELDSLLREIDTLQRAQLQSRTTVRYIERFQIFLGLALLALVASELIPDRQTRRAAAAPTATAATGTAD
jgi:hypothetical protein